MNEPTLHKLDTQIDPKDIPYLDFLAAKIKNLLVGVLDVPF
jgi:hypothetical protein